MNNSYLFLSLLSLMTAVNPLLLAEEESVPAEEMLGERLFLETRFAQSFMANAGKADPLLDNTESLYGSRPGPFKGSNISCRSCHMVDEHKETPQLGMRTYADFARRSPLPSRKDGQRASLRNSMSLVGINSIEGAVFHHDGEFASLQDLVRATFTHRNMGWMPGEEKQAIQHIANIIRNDDGKDELAQEFGGAYATALMGKVGDAILPEQYRIDVSKATDDQIMDTVAELVSVYVAALDFSRDEQGYYNGSAYDTFLAKNNLPRSPSKSETVQNYTKRLQHAAETLTSAKYVRNSDGKLTLHKQKFQFGEQELKGMRIFFGKGNCTTCHTPPAFSDFNFHNTGVSQSEYDALHGPGKFIKLAIPDIKRAASTDPRYQSIASKDKHGYTDLGVWNIIANTTIAASHRDTLHKKLCDNACGNKNVLNRAIGAFKTPLLRDLGHNAPYMHNGSKNSLEDVLAHYIQASSLARNGSLRNSSSEIESIALTMMDIEPVVAFLRALNEDYE